MKKIKTIKYLHYKFKVSSLDKFKIQWIKCVLFIKRWKRRAFHFFPKSGGQYILLLAMWVLFSVIYYFIRKAYLNSATYSWQEAAWELIIPFFTTVILVVAISGYSQAIHYRSIIRDQYRLYIDTLDSFDAIFKPFLKDKLLHYMPFFNDACLQSSLNYMYRENLTGKDFNEEEFIEILEEVGEQLDEIKDTMANDSIIGMHRDTLQWRIKETKKRVRCLIKKREGDQLSYYDFDEVANLLFAIIEDIRRPWRWDIDNNKKIIQLLAQYNENKINDYFYLRMHLYDIQCKENST